MSFGSDGLLLNVSASKGRGNADGADVNWTNTHVEAGNRLALNSGGDTTLKGAVATGKQVIADVGGNLNIESLQDTSQYAGKQQSLGGSVTIGAGVSGSISASQSKINSNFASVTEQSGIKAGDGGFQMDVKGNTDLKGGAITSTQAAIEQDKNRFQTGGTLTTSDIQNQASYDAKSAGINIGSSVSLDGKLAPSGTSAGFGKDSGNAGSSTVAGISGFAGNKDARTGDAETGIARIFDADKVQKEINAQVQITQLFGQQASKAIGDYAAVKTREAAALRDQAGKETDPGRADELKAQAQTLENQWGDQGTLRLAAHTLVGGLTGGTSGAAGAAAGTLTAPEVAKALNDAGVDPTLVTTLTAIASTAAGAAVGGATGAGAALTEVTNNYLSHPQIQAKKDELAKAKTEEERQKINATYAELDAKQRDAAATCLLEGSCASVMDPMAINNVLAQLNAACVPPRLCGADEKASIAELSQLYAKTEAITPNHLVEEWVLGGKLIGTGLNAAKAVWARVVIGEAEGVGAVVASEVKVAENVGVNTGLRTSTTISTDRAEAYLVQNGMSVNRAADFVASFDGPITARLVRPGESFLRYTDTANSTGSFLTKTQFPNPAAAVDGLYLGPYGNTASLMQPVTASGRSIMFEGGIANGGTGVRQSVIINRGAFQFGTGLGY